MSTQAAGNGFIEAIRKLSPEGQRRTWLGIIEVALTMQMWGGRVPEEE